MGTESKNRSAGEFLRLASSTIVVFLLCPMAVLGDSGQPLTGIDRVRALENPRRIRDVQLTDHRGNPFVLSDLSGEIALVFFGFTNCPDVCPATLAKFRLAHEKLANTADRATFVLISVDGDRDTPEVMAEYLGRFSEEFVGATGDPEVVRNLAKEFGASFFKGHEAMPGHYSVGHSPQSFLLDSDGVLRAELYDPSVDAILKVVEGLGPDQGQYSD